MIKQKLGRLFVALLILLGIGTASISTAIAANLDQARAAGWVCEQPDGYVRLAKAGAPGDIQALVKSVNDQRRAEYQRIAQKNNVDVGQVARLTAQKVINGAPQYLCK